MKTQLYQINVNFARRNNMPSIFAGTVLRETERAIYVYGHGTMESSKTGSCCVCGRELTHPVSVILGIGPECGGHWWDWKAIGGYSVENIERLKQEMLVRMEGMKVDSWMPRSVVKSTEECVAEINIPTGHKMLNGKAKQENKIERTTVLVKFQSTGEVGLRILFPFNQDDLTKIKTLDYRKYNSAHKYWTCPVTKENVEKLRSWGFPVDSRVDDIINRQKVNIDSLDDSQVVIPELGMELFPYQRKGVAFLEAKDGRALIADEMGLGKTAQALAWLQLRKEVRPVLIVVPASLKLNWEREAQMWMSNPRIQILQGILPYDIDSKAELVIINYDILSGWAQALTAHGFKCIVADEVHYAKNNSAQRTKALKRLVKTVPHFIGLSGTPIVNRPVEFFNAIKMVEPSLFPSFWEYADKYCDKKHNGFGWDFSGASNTEELHKRLTSTIMIRRKKEDVLTELPDKIRSFFPIELGNRDEYSAAEGDFINWIKKNKGTEAADKASNAAALAEIEGLKQLAVAGKMPQVLTWINDFLESGEKLVVMATHKLTIETIMSEFKDKAVKVDGSVSGVNRQLAVDKFQNDPETRLFVGNIKAAGVGITLTAASNVAFVELPWSPGDLNQAEDRCHRIGQKDTVNIYYLLAKNTIEEKIAALLDSKRKVLDAVLDGKESTEESLLTEIINTYKA